jgi:hypothetical protein
MTNISTRPIDLTWSANPLMDLHFTVTSPSGTRTSPPLHPGFAIHDPLHSARIAPAAAFTFPKVDLSGVCGLAEQGKYVVVVAFKFLASDKTGRSQVYEVTSNPLNILVTNVPPVPKGLENPLSLPQAQ